MRRRHEVLVGVLVIVAITVGVFGTIWLVRGGLGSGYPLYARFPWGAGLAQGQPVLLAGVTVGYLADVQLDPNGTIVVEMRVLDEYRVPVTTTATVVPVGIFGDQAIALTPSQPDARALSEGDTVPIGASAATTAELLARADSVLSNVSAITGRFQTELVEGGGIAELRQTLASTNALVSELSAIAGVQSRQLSATMASVRRTIGALDSASIESTVRSLSTTSANVAQLTAELQGTVLRVNSLLAQADSGDGTIGRLLGDDGLYEDLRGLTARLDSLVVDLQANPRKYVNLRIF